MTLDDPEAARPRPFDVPEDGAAPADPGPEAVEVDAGARLAGRHRSATAALVRTGAPWSFRLDARHAGAFAAMVGGVGWLHRPEAGPVRLHTGDLVLLPRPGTGHGLASSSHWPLEPDAAVEPREEARPGDGSAAVIFGSYAVGAAGHPLLHGLPPVVHVRSGAGRPGAMLEETLRRLAAELGRDRPAPTALDLLVDVLVVHAVLTWRSSGRRAPAGRGDRPRDAAVTRAIAYIDADPARRWTAGQLAAEVGLPRAAFVRRFTASVGDPPVVYLTRWRLGLAARRLRDSDEALSVIARSVGYGSELSFSRAFSRAYGRPPGRYRAGRSGATGPG